MQDRIGSAPLRGLAPSPPAWYGMLVMTVTAGRFLRSVANLGMLVLAGCGSADAPEHVWGRRGVMPGDIVRPRAAAILGDRIYLVDFTARVQAYDLDGQFLNVGWTTPDFRIGRPSGLSADTDGNIIVSDSHYNCVRIYSPDGVELRQLSGAFGYVSDCVRAADGGFFVSEFGAADRISKLDADGQFVRAFGKLGTGPGEFSHIRALAVDAAGHLYVADAGNHRVQVFDGDGQFLRTWGSAGREPGQLAYPYDVAIGRGGAVYVTEYDNHRVQKFTPDGRSLGCWGGPGRAPGKLHNPWALAVDRFGRVHVVDSENHRVQRIRL